MSRYGILATDKTAPGCQNTRHEKPKGHDCKSKGHDGLTQPGGYVSKLGRLPLILDDDQIQGIPGQHAADNACDQSVDQREPHEPLRRQISRKEIDRDVSTFSRSHHRTEHRDPENQYAYERISPENTVVIQISEQDLDERERQYQRQHNDQGAVFDPMQ